MTIRFLRSTVGDKLLALVGKKRAFNIPTEIYNKFGPYVIVQAKRESLRRAFFRPKNQEPPDGWFYLIK